jgi:pimeloyl-ACP methyl ester carboxylesterase
LLSALLMAACAPAWSDGAAGAQGEECVVLLHVLGRTNRSMTPLARALQRAGYATVNLDYPSRSQTIEALATRVPAQGVEECRARGAGRIHFVTHSMGAILLRLYLKEHRPPELGRVVMLSPPNQGSEIADRLHDNALYRWFNGPAGQELGRNGLPAALGPVDYPVGIITGDSPAWWDRWFSSRLIPGEDDGKVSVESARLEGMQDFLVVPYSHTFIMRREAVIRQVIRFLQTGRFLHPDSPDPSGPRGASRH